MDFCGDYIDDQKKYDDPDDHEEPVGFEYRADDVEHREYAAHIHLFRGNKINCCDELLFFALFGVINGRGTDSLVSV